jgi:hypothetical protein
MEGSQVKRKIYPRFHIVIHVSLLPLLFLGYSIGSDGVEAEGQSTRADDSASGRLEMSALYTEPRDEAIPKALAILRSDSSSMSLGTRKAAFDVLARQKAGDYPEAFDLALSSLNDSYVFRECVEILASAPPKRSQEVVDTLVAYLLIHRDDSPRFTDACDGIYMVGNGHDTGATRIRPLANYTASNSPYALSESAAACGALIGMMGMSDFLTTIETGPTGEKAAFLFALWGIAADTQGSFDVDDLTRQRIVDFIFESYSSPDTVVVNQAIRYGTTAIVLGHYMGNAPSLPRQYVDSVLITLDNIASSSTQSTVREEAASRADRLRKFIEHERTGQ